jgi:hypothetical protein
MLEAKKEKQVKRKNSHNIRPKREKAKLKSKNKRSINRNYTKKIA